MGVPLRNPGGSGRSRPILSNQRLSVCKECEEGVYSRQSRIWSGHPTKTGLVHTECAKRAELPTVGEATVGGEPIKTQRKH